MAHDNVLSICLVLDGKMLDINMVKLLSWHTVFDHIDSRHVVFIEQNGTILGVSYFQKDSTKVFSMLGGCDSSKNLASVLEIAVVD